MTYDAPPLSISLSIYFYLSISIYLSLCGWSIDVVYSVSLYDTDLNEEVWMEPAAHHGVVYEMRWTRDDRYMLSCSGDGTCKVWDMRSVLYRSSNTMGFNAILSNTSDSSANTTAPAVQAANKPPSIMFILSSSPPVYTYTAVFQEQMPTALSTTGDDKRELPRIITGGADGRLRVWDDGEMKGLIVVSYKGRDGKQEVDDSPHEGQVNSIVIDERSRCVYLLTYLPTYPPTYLPTYPPTYLPTVCTHSLCSTAVETMSLNGMISRLYALLC